jgi:RNA polymerase sigma-70 factor (ECF subfamily)
MDEQEWLAQRFEEHRGRLRAVAYRMLGSTGEADDAVQEAWLRLARSGAGGVENLGGWLTTVVARVSLNMLRARSTRREVSLEGPLDEAARGPLGPRVVPDPIVGSADGVDPEQEALLADSVGLALLVVLETLSPLERLAFVLHDTFGMPFAEIARIVDRTPAATRQLASRARRRVRSTAPIPDADLARQREVVDAFLAAAREGDFGALLSVLDPDVALRADTGDTPREVRGAEAVADQALLFSRLGGPGRVSRPALVNGTAGVVNWGPDGRPSSVLGFTVSGGRIVEIDILADPERLGRLDLSALEG